MTHTRHINSSETLPASPSHYTESPTSSKQLTVATLVWHCCLSGHFWKSPDFSFPCSSTGKESACNVGDLGLIPWLGRSLGDGKGYALQYSCLENSMGYGSWGHKELDTTERYSPDVSASSLTYLQSILCIEARVNCLACKWGHVITWLKILQWPPSLNRVKLKILQWPTRPCKICTWIFLAPSHCTGSA